MCVHMSKSQKIARHGPRLPPHPRESQVLLAKCWMKLASSIPTAVWLVPEGDNKTMALGKKSLFALLPAQLTPQLSWLCFSQSKDLPTTSLLPRPVCTHQSVQEPHLGSDTRSLSPPLNLDLLPEPNNSIFIPVGWGSFFSLPLDPKQIGGASPQGRGEARGKE